MINSSYALHFGAAKSALARFQSLPLIVELSAANPKLVKKIELVPASLRPLQWSIRLEKQVKDSNDPRFGLIPRTISIEGSSYPVIVR